VEKEAGEQLCKYVQTCQGPSGKVLPFCKATGMKCTGDPMGYPGTTGARSMSVTESQALREIHKQLVDQGKADGHRAPSGPEQTNLSTPQQAGGCDGNCGCKSAKADELNAHFQDGFTEGFEDGHGTGLQDGYADGYSDGRKDGAAEARMNAETFDDEDPQGLLNRLCDLFCSNRKLKLHLEYGCQLLGVDAKPDAGMVGFTIPGLCKKGKGWWEEQDKSRFLREEEGAWCEADDEEFRKLVAKHFDVFPENHVFTIRTGTRSFAKRLDNYTADRMALGWVACLEDQELWSIQTAINIVLKRAKVEQPLDNVFLGMRFVNIFITPGHIWLGAKGQYADEHSMDCRGSIGGHKCVHMENIIQDRLSLEGYTEAFNEARQAWTAGDTERAFEVMFHWRQSVARPFEKIRQIPADAKERAMEIGNRSFGKMVARDLSYGVGGAKLSKEDKSSLREKQVISAAQTIMQERAATEGMTKAKSLYQHTVWDELGARERQEFMDEMNKALSDAMEARPTYEEMTPEAWDELIASTADENAPPVLTKEQVANFIAKTKDANFVGSIKQSLREIKGSVYIPEGVMAELKPMRLDWEDMTEDQQQSALEHVPGMVPGGTLVSGFLPEELGPMPKPGDKFNCTMEIRNHRPGQMVPMPIDEAKPVRITEEMLEFSKPRGRTHMEVLRGHTTFESAEGWMDNDGADREDRYDNPNVPSAVHQAMEDVKAARICPPEEEMQVESALCRLHQMASGCGRYEGSLEVTQGHIEVELDKTALFVQAGLGYMTIHLDGRKPTVCHKQIKAEKPDVIYETMTIPFSSK